MKDRIYQNAARICGGIVGGMLVGITAGGYAVEFVESRTAALVAFWGPIAVAALAGGYSGGRVMRRILHPSHKQVTLREKGRWHMAASIAFWAITGVLLAAVPVAARVDYSINPDPYDRYTPFGAILLGSAIIAASAGACLARRTLAAKKKRPQPSRTVDKVDIVCRNVARAYGGLVAAMVVGVPLGVFGIAAIRPPDWAVVHEGLDELMLYTTAAGTALVAGHVAGKLIDKSKGKTHILGAAIGLPLLAYSLAGIFTAIVYKSTPFPDLRADHVARLNHPKRISFGWVTYYSRPRPDLDDPLHHCSTENGSKSIEIGIFWDIRESDWTTCGCLGIPLSRDIKLGIARIKESAVWAFE